MYRMYKKDFGFFGLFFFWFVYSHHFACFPMCKTLANGPHLASSVIIFASPDNEEVTSGAGSLLLCRMSEWQNAVLVFGASINTGR